MFPYGVLSVKKYGLYFPGDIYVHADLHGASSVLIKNTTGKTKVVGPSSVKINKTFVHKIVNIFNRYR